MAENREKWGSRIGVILAVAGSAVGLGNFLRFPTKAVLNGGGAFLIPYFVALIFLGIPLMWVEWTLGRYGGRFGHGTAPGVFQKLGNNKILKYLGVLGTLIPFLVLIYYMYIESWTLGYAFFSFTGELFQVTNQESMKNFLSNYQGIGEGSSFTTALIFFAITFFTNFYFIYKGLQGGIEKLSKIGMPILIIIGVILAVRVLTLGTPDPTVPEQSIDNALGFFWNPDFSQLTNAKVWIEAAGQIFFTLSVGMGMIITYASYLSDKDDIALSGLSSSSINEFCEVVLGGSIVVPAVFVFFGAAGAFSIVQSGTFNVGFVTMPLIFEKLPFGFVFSGLWFLLLFIAGITSSVSMIQSMMSFLEDEFKVTRKKATIILGLISFLASLPAIFFIQHGFLDELDFWSATLFVVVFATIEILIFVFLMGINKGWEEMHIGAIIKIPSFYKFILKYITPLYLIIMLVVWFYQQFIHIILLEGVNEIDKPYVWAARGMILLFVLVNTYLVYLAWKNHNKEKEEKL